MLADVPATFIKETQNYWLVRTQSGEYYDEFFHDNFIGIGWDKLQPKDASDDESILIKILEEFPDEKQPGRILSQIKRFIFDLKIGDIVIIPSQTSSVLSFGRIESDVYIKEVDEIDVFMGACSFQKRKKVSWIKTIRRDELDPYLYKLLNSHHTISNATPYAEYIDRTIHSFYVKGTSAHLILNVQKRGQISAIDLVQLLRNTLDLVPIVSELTGEEFSADDLDIKLTVNSPGIIEIIAYMTPVLVLGIGILLHYIVGGELKGSASYTKSEGRLEVESSSEGLIEKILKIKVHKDNNYIRELEITQKLALEKLNVKLPEELKKLPTPVDMSGEN
jgi:restriction system protein